jgi:hypothetical protein
MSDTDTRFGRPEISEADRFITDGLWHARRADVQILEDFGPAKVITLRLVAFRDPPAGFTLPDDAVKQHLAAALAKSAAVQRVRELRLRWKALQAKIAPASSECDAAEAAVAGSVLLEDDALHRAIRRRSEAAEALAALEKALTQTDDELETAGRRAVQDAEQAGRELWGEIRRTLPTVDDALEALSTAMTQQLDRLFAASRLERDSAQFELGLVRLAKNMLGV